MAHVLGDHYDPIMGTYLPDGVSYDTIYGSQADQTDTARPSAMPGTAGQTSSSLSLTSALQKYSTQIYIAAGALLVLAVLTRPRR